MLLSSNLANANSNQFFKLKYKNKNYVYEVFTKFTSVKKIKTIYDKQKKAH